MRVLIRIIFLFVLILPASAYSGIDFSLRIGTGASILVNMPQDAIDSTPRVSLPVMVNIGFLIDKKIGFHLIYDQPWLWIECGDLRLVEVWL